ncbi:MAG: UDP-N-acetylglucosamine--N-acetylmuramyl-(pentapeptide) pyrophosphoryl-undecaprenol N-acetylglucosamine transferase [Candidatus Pacebacteria bacterium]|nr:UDP-N-acetylglucosamine--N-acetylmuramyl-(pentapeptide) pyrophosphoryl-undecaprenol N-acetylglucosamine transferase [Candidatus Paceibacterota bacterium]
MKVVLTGGGTGGHIFPLVSVERELKIESDNEVDFLYIGPRDDFSVEAFERENIPVKRISAGKIRRYLALDSILNNLLDLFIRIPLGFIQSFWILCRYRPQGVFSKGGYGSVPVVMMARLLNISIFLHESDSIPGFANRLISVLATQVFISFPDSNKYFSDQKTILSGNPIRSSINRRYDSGLKKVFDIVGGKPLLVILGGSQGSVRLNNIIIENLDYLLEKFEIIHQTGRIDHERVLKARNTCKYVERYHVYDFFDEEKMAIALSFADCAISRSGSSSITELAAIGVPCVLIPLPESAQNHQLHNALTYCKETRSCIVIEEKDLVSEKFYSSIDQVLGMDKAMVIEQTRIFSRRNASNVIAKKILEEIKNDK